MEVILKQDIDKIGKSGSVVKVKDGFARNFLFPNNMALPLTSANLKKLEEEKKIKATQLDKARNACEEKKKRIESLSLTISALVQDDEKLYGSVTEQEIANALEEEGLQIDKNLIILAEPIKSLGIYEIPVKLHPEVTAKVKVWIVKK